MLDFGAVTEDRDRARQRGRLCTETAELQAYPSDDRPRAHLREPGHALRARGEPFRDDHTGQLTQQERISAGQIVTGRHERVLDLARDERAQQLCRTVDAERGETQDGDRWVGDQLVEQPLVGAGLSRSQRR